MIQPKTWNNMSGTTKKSLERMIKTSMTMSLQDAIDMFRDIIKREPELIPAKEHLRELEIRKATETQAKPEGGMTNFLLSCKTALAGTNYLKAIAFCEDVLSKNVNNVQLLKMVAGFSEKAKAYFIGIDAIKTAIHFEPQNTDLKIYLGSLYMKDDAPEKAKEIYQELYDNAPDKNTYKHLLREAMNAIDEKEELARQRAEELQNSNKSKIQTRDSQEAIVQQLLDGTIRDVDQAKLVISELSKVLEKKESLDVRRKLAEAYKIAQDYDTAIYHLEFVAKALNAFDANLDKDIEKLYVKKYDLAIQAIENNPNAYDNAQQQLTDLEIARMQFKLERAIIRSNANINDAQLHYELGLEYYDCGMSEEALKEFTIASDHPRWQPQCTYYMGRVVLNMDNVPLAVEYLSKASEMIGLREPNYKKCFYYLGIAHEKNGDAEKARQAYERLFKVDPNFLDVASKLS
ncbi:MAG: tetratricopeptide repeat protein [Lentisphaeria bacterium]|nr:tetratricopeptide repeat protein [Lentisphaeria bacterium]